MFDAWAIVEKGVLAYAHVRSIPLLFSVQLRGLVSVRTVYLAGTRSTMYFVFSRLSVDGRSAEKKDVFYHAVYGGVHAALLFLHVDFAVCDHGFLCFFGSSSELFFTFYHFQFAVLRAGPGLSLLSAHALLF